MLEEQDLKQISNLLKENNKKIKDDFKTETSGLKTEIVDEMAGIVNDAFGEHEEQINKKLDELKLELDKKPSKEALFGWGGKRIEPIELDVDRLKYVNIDKLKNMPGQPEITAKLIKAGLK